MNGKYGIYQKCKHDNLCWTESCPKRKLCLVYCGNAQEVKVRCKKNASKHPNVFLAIEEKSGICQPELHCTQIVRVHTNLLKKRKRWSSSWFSVGWKWGYLVFFVAKYNEAILLVFLVEKYTLSNYLDASKNTTVCSVFTCVCCVIFSLNVCSVSYLCFSCCCICVLFLSWSCLIFIVFVFYLLSYFCCICHCICVVAKCSQTSHLCE